MASNGKSLLQRMEELEVQTQALRGLQAAIQNVQQATRQTLAILSAFIQEMGGDELDQKIAGRMADQEKAFMQKRLEEQKRVLEDLVKTGQLVAGSAVDKDSVLTFKQYNLETTSKTPEAGADGVVPEAVTETKETLSQEYGQAHYTQLPPALGDKLVGLKVGESFTDAENGFRFEITGVFVPAAANPQKTSEVPPNPAEVKTEAKTEAEAPVAEATTPAPEATPTETQPA